MNYNKIYEQIINDAQNKNRKRNKVTYYEKHHIVPKCLNGSDVLDNLVLLTAKEHFVCHRLLTKIYPSNIKLHSAFVMMSMQSCNQQRVVVNSNKYKLSKEFIRQHKSQKMTEYNKLNPKLGQNNGMFGSHRIGKQNPFHGKTHTQSSKNKIGLKNLGRIPSEETRDKLKEVWKTRTGIICPHCQKESIHMGNMRRYHFENCKLLKS